MQHQKELSEVLKKMGQVKPIEKSGEPAIVVE